MSNPTKIHRAYDVDGLTKHEAMTARFWDGEVTTTAHLADLTPAIVRRAMKKKAVIQAIRNREKHEDRSGSPIANRKRRQQFWTEIMFDELMPVQQRLKASELLGKSEADFTDKHVVDGNLTLNEALAGLDEGPPIRRLDVDPILN